MLHNVFATAQGSNIVCRFAHYICSLHLASGMLIAIIQKGMRQQRTHHRPVAALASADECSDHQ